MEVEAGRAGRLVRAEVVALRGDAAILLPLGDARVGRPRRGASGGPADGSRSGWGAACWGGCSTGWGAPSTDGRCRRGLAAWEVDRAAPGPLERPRLGRPFATGVRAVDGFATLAEGQRVGLFAGPGVGKSSLLGRLARGRGRRGLRRWGWWGSAAGRSARSSRTRSGPEGLAPQRGGGGHQRRAGRGADAVGPGRHRRGRVVRAGRGAERAPARRLAHPVRPGRAGGGARRRRAAGAAGLPGPGLLRAAAAPGAGRDRARAAHHRRLHGPLGRGRGRGPDLGGDPGAPRRPPRPRSPDRRGRAPPGRRRAREPLPGHAGRDRGRAPGRGGAGAAGASAGGRRRGT